jgi:hypothetical protein
MRQLVLHQKSRPPFIDWITLFGGATERAIALTLVLMAPSYLPSFIGGWVLLKFAIGWQREKHGSQIGAKLFGFDRQRPFIRDSYRDRRSSQSQGT